MANKFVIIFNNASKEQQDLITHRLQGTKYQFWHWMENVWLVTTDENVTAKSFAEWLEKFTGITRFYVVFRIDGPCPYWGRNIDEAWKWMAKFWGPPDV